MNLSKEISFRNLDVFPKMFLIQLSCCYYIDNTVKKGGHLAKFEAKIDKKVYSYVIFAISFLFTENILYGQIYNTLVDISKVPGINQGIHYKCGEPKEITVKQNIFKI